MPSATTASSMQRPRRAVQSKYRVYQTVQGCTELLGCPGTPPRPKSGKRFSRLTNGGYWKVGKGGHKTHGRLEGIRGRREGEGSCGTQSHKNASHGIACQSRQVLERAHANRIRREARSNLCFCAAAKASKGVLSCQKRWKSGKDLGLCWGSVSREVAELESCRRFCSVKRGGVTQRSSNEEMNGGHLLDVQYGIVLLEAEVILVESRRIGSSTRGMRKDACPVLLGSPSFLIQLGRLERWPPVSNFLACTACHSGSQCRQY